MPKAADAERPRSRTARRPRRAAEVLRAMRGALASLRAASETLQAYPQADPSMRERLVAVIAEEAGRLGSGLQELERARADVEHGTPDRRGPVSAETVVQALAGALAASGLECLEEASPAGGVPRMHLRVDTDALAGAARAFFTALRRQSPVGSCTLRPTVHEGHLLLDVQWPPSPADIPRLLAWQGEALGAGAADTGSGRLRAVVRQHAGEAWFALDRDGSTARVRILLPGS